MKVAEVGLLVLLLSLKEKLCIFPTGSLSSVRGGRGQHKLVTDWGALILVLVPPSAHKLLSPFLGLSDNHSTTVLGRSPRIKGSWGFVWAQLTEKSVH